MAWSGKYGHHKLKFELVDICPYFRAPIEWAAKLDFVNA
jgi:hypothetical protein